MYCCGWLGQGQHPGSFKFANEDLSQFQPPLGLLCIRDSFVLVVALRHAPPATKVSWTISSLLAGCFMVVK